MFQPESPYPVITPEEAWRRIAKQLKPLAPTSVAVSRALGLVLAEDVAASENMPPFPSSAMDGYAVIAADPTTERRVIGQQDAGLAQGLVVKPGTAARLMTGGSVPEGADAVIPVEQTRESGGVVTLLAKVKPGQNVRPVGQDFRAGELVLDKGAVLGPAEIGLLAMVGRAEVLAHPRPRVAVMATGNELVPPGEPLAPGQIRDSNSYALLAAVEAAGATPVYLGRIPDDEAALRAALERGLAEADLTLSSGGVSMGARDLIKPLLAELGTVHFGRVAIKPGKPLTFATARGAAVLGLPGFPVSSLVMFEMFARPALRLLGGHTKLWRPELQVRLAHDVRHDDDRTEFQRAVVEWRDGEPWAATTGVQVSGRLKSLVGANALLRLPAGQGDFARGATVTALMITQPEV